MRFLSSSGVSIALLASSTWAQPSSGFRLRRREIDNPSTSDFLRRSFAAATVIGDYVYIDGGEVSQVVNGVQPSTDRPSRPVNSTLSISLKESWTNATVPINNITKQAPVLNSQAIWTDSSSDSFWIWSGAASAPDEPPVDESWQFFADGNGSGFWSIKTPANTKVFDQLVRPEGCAFTQKDNDVGYCMGGLVTSQSNASVTSDTAISGLVSFGMTSNVWTNTSTPGIGTLVNGAAEFVPFGPNGLMVFLGGAEAPAGTFDAASTSDRDFTNITFLDPITQQSFTQNTTGTPPSGRQRFCTVGVQGPSNTYEIFMYGGLQGQSNATSDEVFVLSLPGFVYSKATGPSTARADHACVVVGSGKRQMLSVGGTDASLGYAASLLEADPWSQGLGVFDMTAMQWTSSYDANASAYDTPDVVKQFYTSGGLDKVVWSSDSVKEIFTSATPDFGSSVGGSGSSASSPGTSNNKPAISLATIIGLACAGGVVVLGTAAGSLFYLLRRRRRRRSSPSATTDPKAPCLATSSRPYKQLREPTSAQTWDKTTFAQPQTQQQQQRPGTSGTGAKGGGGGGYSVFVKGNATPLIPPTPRGQPLGSNPITLRSDLASRRGVRPLRAIRTGEGPPQSVRGIRVYQGNVRAGGGEDGVGKAR
ncbi:Kelch repeat protein [Pleurostoma richardsiae]|uniref:Kelch repeat protein n=1 Tax=Pleurostoma richardsiae TaxID=41990 RepID=A0AA38R7F5_9PEZI|nr:Kelch repeat protein [Pleurostoma richardsiae]